MIISNDKILQIVKIELRVERGIHSEGFGYAVGRNKGESGGGFVYGDRRFNGWGVFGRHRRYAERWEPYARDISTVTRVSLGCVGESKGLGVEESEQTVFAMPSTALEIEGNEEVDDSENLSSESLYKINEGMLLEWRKESDVAEVIGSAAVNSTEVDGFVLSGQTKGANLVLECADASVHDGRAAEPVAWNADYTLCDDGNRGTQLVADNCGDNQGLSDGGSEDDDSIEEVVESKGLWKRSGLFFYSSDDDEVLVRLFNYDLDSVKRAIKKSKKQKQGRKPPNIQGRTLATKRLLSGAKQKLR
ncbi:hypothetical protein PIB30_086755 [Stylosanthes scabra]|uniref:Uncharacterized protein n=1 Tax=Stylosanthes scabra TaxID=79078 RepID=A0ABU6TV69_9FABA|nr:hypothetical protein [Stylosanthes scabra]